MAAKTVFLKHKLENRIMSLRGFRVFQGFPLAWGESPSPHLFDVGDKSFTPSLKPEESTDFTHYFADFVKKHLTPPMPLGLGHATAPSFSNTLPELPIATILCLC